MNKLLIYIKDILESLDIYINFNSKDI